MAYGIGVALIGTFLVSPAAVADETSDWSQVQANLDFFEVPAAQQQTIHSKFDAGEALDAFTEAVPVSTDVLGQGRIEVDCRAFRRWFLRRYFGSG